MNSDHLSDAGNGSQARNQAFQTLEGVPSQPASGEFAAHLRLTYLLMTAALLGVCLLWVMSKDQLAQARLASQRAASRSAVAPDFPRLLAADPAVGRLIPRGRFGEIVDRSAPRPCLLVFVAGCASCVHADVAGWRANAVANGADFVLITSAGRAERSLLLTQLGLPATTRVIHHAQDLGELNLVFSPRAYLLDRHSRLLWLQRTNADFGYNPFSDDTLRHALLGVPHEE